MAAAIKALNAKIRSNPVSDYFCSTHFWGPASNFGIPIAAVLDTQKDPEIISGKFTAALTVYSATFMRYAMAVTPKNYLLFGCHVVNFGAQITQGGRWYQYWYMGGQQQRLASGLSGDAKKVAGDAEGKAEQIGERAETLAADIKAKGKSVVEEVKKKVS